MSEPMQVENSSNKNKPNNRNRGRGGGGRGGGGRGRGRGGGRGGRGRGGRGRGGGGGRGNNNNNNNRNDSGMDEEHFNNPKKHTSPRDGSGPKNKRPKRKTEDGGASAPPPVKDQPMMDATASNGGGNKLAHITDKKFSDLQISGSSRKALAEVFKYECMTVVQAETLPLILEGKEVLAKAKTGTGKTLAFMIPTIEKMVHKTHSTSDICCLVISPTRELAQQISTETEKLLSFHNEDLRKVVTCVGGTNKNKDVKALKGKTPIVVATPGRLLDHLQNGGLAARMANLDSLIFDEADQLLDMGFRPDIERILRLIEPSRKTRQTLLFSATVPKSVSEVAHIALRDGYTYVDTVGEDSEQTHLHVQQQLLVAPQEEQVLALANILARETSQKPYKIIVFFTTARLTGFMAELFNSVADQTGYKVLEIHSRKSQKQRERASDAFRNFKNAIMFSSDVTARGMDYPDVTFVLQVGLTERSQYIHRLGRTARAGKDGKGALLLADYEQFHMTKKELGDMPLEATPVPESEQVNQTVANAIANVSRIKGLQNTAEQSYRAWLGYYNGHLKKVRWDKKQLVVQANLWATQNGLKNQPGLQKRTIGKMGLKGVPGIRIEG